jgi:hypothetical protein
MIDWLISLITRSRSTAEAAGRDITGIATPADEAETRRRERARPGATLSYRQAHQVDTPASVRGAGLIRAAKFFADGRNHRQ